MKAAKRRTVCRPLARRRFRRARAVGAVAALVVSLPAAAGTLEVNSTAALEGSSGLEVSTGLTCIAPDDLLVDSPATISGTFTACENLTAASVQVVAPGAIFQAELSVTLDNDFSVASGAELTIESGMSPVVPFAFVTDESPASTTTYRATYRVDLDPLTLGNGDELANLAAGTVSADHLQVVFTRSGGQDQVFVRARLDDGTFADGLPVALPAGENLLEVKWVAGVGSGSLVLSLNGSAFAGVLDLDNDQARIDRVRWGAVAGSATGTSGSFYLDDFSSGPF